MNSELLRLHDAEDPPLQNDNNNGGMNASLGNASAASFSFWHHNKPELHTEAPGSRDDDDDNDKDAESDHDDDDEDDDGSSTNISESKQGSNNVMGGRYSEIAQKERNAQLSSQENKRVWYARLLLFLVLAASAGIVSYFTWWFVTNEETEDYTTRFEIDAQELIRISNANANSIFGVLEIFATLLGSGAATEDDNGSGGTAMPLYALPDFERFGGSARQLSGALLIAFSPLVTMQDRPAYENFTVANQDWISKGLVYLGDRTTVPALITPFIYRKTARSFVPEQASAEVLSPVWQMTPAPTKTSNVNFNLYNHPTVRRLIQFAKVTRQAAISEVLDTQLVFGDSAPQAGADPQSLIVLPVLQATHGQAPSTDDAIVGHVIAVVPWGLFFQDVLQQGQNGVVAVLRESCANGQDFTYLVQGKNATFLGIGDFHNARYDARVQTTRFRAYEQKDDSFREDDLLTDHCEYQLDVYPSSQYEDAYRSNQPVVFLIGVLAVFVFTSVVFVLYECAVRQRQEKVVQVATKSGAIVSSLFPEQVRDKLFASQEVPQETKKTSIFKSITGGGESAAAAALTSGGEDGEDGGKASSANPADGVIADLFPSATILFMDIPGFTPWASAREPPQVFIFLETVFKAFDKFARRRRVFKVETMGDCYLAVTGLPEPMEDHAVPMARFAKDCLHKFTDLVRKLEVRLGPDTSDLKLRVGMHSGPVTAGVLRGERRRYNIFGDTVNTASRMESTGAVDKIQMSQETAELLMAAGKGHWITPRADKVFAKGKGELSTFWLTPKSQMYPAATTATSLSEGAQSRAEYVEAMNWVEQHQQEQEQQQQQGGGMRSSMMQSGSNRRQSFLLENLAGTDSEKTQRLVEYNCKLLSKALRKVVAKRGSSTAKVSKKERTAVQELEETLGREGSCMEEVEELIPFPEFDAAAAAEAASKQPHGVNAHLADSMGVLDEEVESQLTSYVETIASMYRGNPFHNIERASHVVQSSQKLLTRILAADAIDHDMLQDVHDHTFGIASDPLTQFAVLFASLIHDVDHRGVPNSVLIQEDPALAALYGNVLVAEQNSVDIAWLLLMDPKFSDLRSCIYKTVSELRRFRQLVVHLVLATADVSKEDDEEESELAAKRAVRWEKAFGTQEPSLGDSDAMHLKATLVLEHLIQASAMSYCMQHWNVYTKWDERFFKETYVSYATGRTEIDPTETWYTRGLQFLDTHAIPLARKLMQCGVFGVSGDEYLQYAMSNRREWEKLGMEFVRSTSEKIKAQMPR